MAIFSSSERERQKSREELLKSEIPSDASLEEELAELTAAAGTPQEVNRARSQAEADATEATRNDIRAIRLIEQGRCPHCRGRTENFLYTTVCAACGWYRRRVPETGRCVVYLATSDRICCDHVHRTADEEYLCIRGGVVVSQVMRRHVQRIDYHWEADELDRARDELQRHQNGVCSWCEKNLTGGEEAPLVDYVAFGAMQERFVFCSEKCMKEFRHQYPSRVHRNCYEKDCRECDLCIKRYDVDGFRRVSIG